MFDFLRCCTFRDKCHTHPIDSGRHTDRPSDALRQSDTDTLVYHNLKSVWGIGASFWGTHPFYTPLPATPSPPTLPSRSPYATPLYAAPTHHARLSYPNRPILNSTMVCSVFDKALDTSEAKMLAQPLQ